MAKKDSEVSYPIQLTWAKTWAVILVALGCVGGIYRAGVYSQKEKTCVETAKYEKQVWLQAQAAIATTENNLLIANKNLEFYRDQYRVTKSRLDTCLEGGTFFDKEEK